MKKTLLFPLLTLALAACNLSSSPETNPAPASVRHLGTLEVTFRGDDAVATLGDSGLTPQATVGLGNPVLLSKGLIDKDGVRYLHATFQFANSTSTPIQNLHLYAQTNATTLAGTAISQLTNALNQTPQNATTLARQITPTHRMQDNSGTVTVKASEADFQAYSPSQVAAVQTPDLTGSGTTILDYGFAAKHATSKQRAIPTGSNAVVTFAVQFPFDPNAAASYPFGFTMSYQLIDESPSQTTRTLAEHTPGHKDNVCARAQALGTGTKVMVLGQDSAKPSCPHTTLADIKIAAQAGSLGELYMIGGNTPAPGYNNPQPDPDPQPDPACTKRSTLPCSALPVSLPYILDWTKDEGKLADKNNLGTGFTMVDPPSARIAVDGPISNPDVPGYEPSNLTVNPSAGTLTITSNKGIQFLKPGSGAGTSPNTNSLINALGVGVDAKTQPIVLKTTLTRPTLPDGSTLTGTSAAQQGGLWFGLDEDSYIKLVLFYNGTTNQYKVQMLREVDSVYVQPSGNTPNDQLDSSNFQLGNNTTPVHLTLTINPFTKQATASYQIGTGSVTPLTTLGVNHLVIPDSFFDGVAAQPGAAPSAFTGLFTTHRNATQPLNFTFSNFSVTQP